MKNSIRIGPWALVALTACLPAAAQGIGPSFSGSFVTFDRNLTTVQMWETELSTQAALGHKILVVPGDGTLMPSSQDSTGFGVNPETLIYPSGLFPAIPPRQDNLGMLLTAADRFGMQVYVGSLQTCEEWSTGEEFSALHKYDSIVAGEILARYGSHPSLNSGAGNWYFSHELWLNWIKFYGPAYYGIRELGTYVEEMKSLQPGARVMEAPVMKQASSGIMPGVSSAEAASCLVLLVSGSHVDIVAPQDGAGAQAGAPAVSQLTDYYAQMHTALEASIVSGTAQLWTTAETYQAVVPGAESANGWQPAPVSRIRDQLGAESPYVAQIIEFMYGWDMSPEATFTPVEADTLLSQYTGDASGTTSQTGGTVSCSVFPSSSYPDVVPSNLTDGTGGGFGQPLGRDWVGFAGNPPGVVTVTKELGGPKPSQDCPPNKPTEECHPCK